MPFAYDIVYKVDESNPGAKKRFREETKEHAEFKNPSLHTGSPANSVICEASRWGDTERIHGLQYLKHLAKDQMQAEAEVKELTNGAAPEPPILVLREASPHSLSLEWEPAKDSTTPVSFFILETCGAHGSRTQRANQYYELMRDPPSASDGSMPRMSYLATKLQPNTLYHFRIRAYNGFGSSLSTHGEFSTLPRAPPPPMMMKIAPDWVKLTWSSTYEVMQILKDLKQLFQKCDVNGDGVISRSELEQALKKDPSLLRKVVSDPAVVGDPVIVETLSKAGTIRSQEIPSVFEILSADADCDGSITWEKFREKFVEKAKASGAMSGSVGASATSAAFTKYILLKCINDEEDEYEKVYEGKNTTYVATGLLSGKSYRFRLQVSFSFLSFVKIN